jgi:hypothetical protein
LVPKTTNWRCYWPFWLFFCKIDKVRRHLMSSNTCQIEGFYACLFQLKRFLVRHRQTTPSWAFFGAKKAN